MTWVMFDYGGVLCHHPTDRDMARLAMAAGTAASQFQSAYWQRRIGYDLGELDAYAYWQQVGRDLGRDFGEEESAELTQLDTASWMRLQSGTVALIKDLAGQGWPLAMLSNAPGDLADAVSALPVAEHFRHLIFSCRLKSAKPDPECYSAALAQLGARAQEVIFLDDREENIAAAAALGVRAVHFTDPELARAAVTAQLTGLG